MLKGMTVTLQISAGAFLTGLFLGLCVAYLRLCGRQTLAVFAKGYCTLFRAVPELLLILILFYLGSGVLNALTEALGSQQIELNGAAVATVVLGVVQSAYAAEIFRASILAIPKGQIEAARVYGLSGGKLFRRITLPAMAPNAVAGLANLWINLIKDSALISVVGTSELLYTAKQAAGSTRHYLTFYLLAACLYYILTLASNFATRQIERRARRGLAGAAP